MKKTLLGAVALSVIMLVMPNAHAQDFKPYAGIGLGEYNFKTGGTGGDKRVFGGFGQFGVDIGEYYGAELRLGSSTTTSYPNGAATEESRLDYIFSYLAKAQFPVSPEFRIYALVGGSTGKVTSHLITPGFLYVATGTNTISTTQTSFSFGGGLDFLIYDKLSIGAEYMRYYSDVQGYSANLKYSF